MSTVVTRFAPSPTGLLHAGNYRTAVFAYLYAKHTGGSFILRIEDTDAIRSKPEYEANIHEALDWLNLKADKQYRQSEQHARHRELLEQLIADGTAYVSKEMPKNPGDREEVIRFKNPGGVVAFADVIRGEIQMDVSDLGDFVIARSLDEPIFHFAVVVDDADEGVTHVIRGEDHISNTPRQILIQRALGFAAPVYAHLPLILGSDRTKLSKRKGAKALTEYRDLGIVPEAMLNYLAFLGWNPGDDREYLGVEALIESFDLARVQKGSAIFDETKLLSVNQHWMRKLSDDDFISRGALVASDRERLQKAIPLLKERVHTFAEAREMLAGELSCLFIEPTLDRGQLISKERTSGRTKIYLEDFVARIRHLPESSLTPESVRGEMMLYVDKQTPVSEEGRGPVLWPLRYALSGQERSPDPFTLISILGPAESVSRIKKAIGLLS